MRRVSALLAMAIVLSCGAEALAQNATERARAAYAEGEARSRARDYAAAARAFSEADALAPNDTALEAALEAAILADDPALGMTLVERSERTPSASRLAAAGRARSAFEGRAGVVVVRCLGEPSPCTATVDDVPATTSRTWVSVGPRRVVMRRDERSATENVEVAPRATVEVAFPPPATTDAPAAPAPAPPPTEPLDDEETEGLSPWWFVAGAGITVALAGVTVGHAVAASSAHDDFDAANGKEDVATLERLAADGDSLDTRTNVFLVATLAAAAGTAAIGLFAVDWSGGGGAQATLLPTPDGLALRASGSF